MSWFVRGVENGNRITDPLESLAGTLLVEAFGETGKLVYEKGMIASSIGNAVPDFFLSVNQALAGSDVLIEVTRATSQALSVRKARQVEILDTYAAENPGVEVAVLFVENLIMPEAQLASMIVVDDLARGAMGSLQAKSELLDIANEFARDMPNDCNNLPWQAMISSVLGGG